MPPLKAISQKALVSAKVITAVTVTMALTSAVWSPARAQGRAETLLIVSESGPNNINIHGVGTNVPGYEVSWNCYDRLISHEMKSGPGGVPYYDRDKFKPELAEDMKVGDMSVTPARKALTRSSRCPAVAAASIIAATASVRASDASASARRARLRQSPPAGARPAMRPSHFSAILM